MKENRDHSNDTKIALLQQNNDHIHETLVEIKQKLNSMDSRFDRIENRMWSLHLWNLAQLVGVLYLVAHAFRWI